MAKNILVISCDIRETRVALIENGIIAELHIERRGTQPKGGIVGDVYLGKVTRVLPGLQAAFVDIGLERAAFLHVEDLIRPDDFESYLAGGRKHAIGEGPGGNADSPEDAVSADDAERARDASTTDLAPVESVRDVAEAAAFEHDLHGDHDHEDHEHDHEDHDPDHDHGEEDHHDHPHDDDHPVLAAAGTQTELDAGDAPESGEFETAREGHISGPGARDEENEADPDGHHADAESDIPPSDDSDPNEFEIDDPMALASAHTQDLVGVGVAVGSSPSMIPSMPPPSPSSASVESPRRRYEAKPVADEDLFDNPDLPGFTISDPGAPMPRAVAPARGDRDHSRGRRRRGARGRGRSDGRENQGGGGGGGRDNREGGGGGRSRGRGRADHGGGGGRQATDRNRGQSPNRISKSTPIREVVKEGQEIIVQVTKEPIGTKGARCSSHISLPGRYVVYLPTVEHIGVSKRIGSDQERARLRETIESMKPPTGGLIVRTVAEGLTKKQLKQDVGYLVRLWGDIAKKREGARAPAVLGSELDIVLKTARDLFTDEVHEIVIDDKTQYERLCRFVEMFMPERLKDVTYYDEGEPIFDAYGIEDEIARALARKVPLPSGGYLIIDEAEALTAIDVNTGRFVGKGSKDMEETILKTNLEAVQEIAYQLRFRNIGGLIILDLIDMEKSSNREKVRKKLEELLHRDKAKTTLNRISELGLIEMTRKRTRESLGRLLHEACFYCDGTGHLQSKETIAYDILREIRRKRADLPGYTVNINCHPAVADMLMGPEKAALQDAENRYMRKITVTPRKEYHLEQFDMAGK